LQKILIKNTSIMSGSEIFVILLAVLLLFGSKKIPDAARTIGKGYRELRKATDDIKKEIMDGTSDIREDLTKEVNSLSDIKEIKELNELKDDFKKEI